MSLTLVATVFNPCIKVANSLGGLIVVSRWRFPYNPLFFHSQTLASNNVRHGCDSGYNHCMQRSHTFTEGGRLSILVATILLAYAIIPFVNTPSGQFKITISGISFNLPINFATIVPSLLLPWQWSARTGCCRLTQDIQERPASPISSCPD